MYAILIEYGCKNRVYVDTTGVELKDLRIGPTLKTMKKNIEKFLSSRNHGSSPYIYWVYIIYYFIH